MILGIETASHRLGVALATGSTVLKEIFFEEQAGHDEELVPAIERLMVEARIRPKQLHAVAVSAGPGSFTGLRIGMAAAKGLCLALGIPLLAVPTFDAIAFGVWRRAIFTNPTMLAVVSDARRGDVYVSVYSIGREGWRPTLPVHACPIAQARDQIEDGAWLIGDGADLLFASQPKKFHIISHADLVCRADAVALLGEQRLAEGVTSTAETCEPLYVRHFQTTTPKKMHSTMIARKKED